MIVFSMFSFAIVFVSSLLKNGWETSLFRAIIALGVGLVIGLVFSYLWKWIRLDLKESRSLLDDKENQVPKSKGSSEAQVRENEIEKTSNYVKD